MERRETHNAHSQNRNTRGRVLAEGTRPTEDTAATQHPRLLPRIQAAKSTNIQARMLLLAYQKKNRFPEPCVNMTPGVLECRLGNLWAHRSTNRRGSNRPEVSSRAPLLGQHGLEEAQRHGRWPREIQQCSGIINAAKCSWSSTIEDPTATFKNHLPPKPQPMQGHKTGEHRPQAPPPRKRWRRTAKQDSGNYDPCAHTKGWATMRSVRPRARPRNRAERHKTGMRAD